MYKVEYLTQSFTQLNILLWSFIHEDHYRDIPLWTGKLSCFFLTECFCGTTTKLYTLGSFASLSLFFSSPSLTDSSWPGPRGRKVQETESTSGFMFSLLSKVHFSRTSVPLTASCSPDVYMRIPHASRKPAEHRGGEATHIVVTQVEPAITGHNIQPLHWNIYLKNVFTFGLLFDLDKIRQK